MSALSQFHLFIRRGTFDASQIGADPAPFSMSYLMYGDEIVTLWPTDAGVISRLANANTAGLSGLPEFLRPVSMRTEICVFLQRLVAARISDSSDIPFLWTSADTNILSLTSFPDQGARNVSSTILTYARGSSPSLASYGPWIERGFFTGSYSGFSSTAEAVINYWRWADDLVFLTFESTAAFTSNATGFSLTNLPTHLDPPGGVVLPIKLLDGGNEKIGAAIAGAGQIIFMLPDSDTEVLSDTAFTASGQKGMSNGPSLMYHLSPPPGFP